MFFLSVSGTIRLFFVLYCGCIFLWLEVADYGSDSYFCSCHIGPDQVCFLWVYWCRFVLVFAILLSRLDTLFCCHNKLVLRLRSFGYFANGLLYWYGFYPCLRLFIEHMIHLGIRSGPRRASIVNASVYDRNIYQRLCYTSLRLVSGGSRYTGWTAK